MRVVRISHESVMTPVILESPYAGDIEANLRYLRRCMRDCLLRGEAPFASHGLYTQEGVLRDEVPEEREHGIQAGFAWRSVAKKTVVYLDLGTSKGMEYGIKHALDTGHVIEYRRLDAFVLNVFPCAALAEQKGKLRLPSHTREKTVIVGNDKDIHRLYGYRPDVIKVWGVDWPLGLNRRVWNLALCLVTTGGKVKYVV